MAYKALYRKYRPSTFDEVVGQQHVVSTLKNAIVNNKLAHAYLFCGPRGTGKTSIAKLLAKTINCQSEGDKPCCQCSSCIDIQESSHPDVVELDAASNNGVDEVREIIEKVKYAPMNGKYKVYIIDEVHMMTSSAFNALLKTLEEPPEYCIFILATTEPHKVLPTIISRCQRFDFKKISKEIIAGRIKEICKKEDIKCTDDAIDLIAELADGGMRDSLSILDQCIAYAGENIKIEDVSEVYGVASITNKIDLFKCVFDKNSKELINKINELSTKGIDIQRLTIDLINIAKDCIVYSYSKDKTTLKKLTVEQAEQLLKMFSATQLLSHIDNLMECQARYRGSSNPLTYFEVCLLKMMNYQNVEIIEKSVSQKVITPFETKTKDFDPTVKRNYVNYTDDEIYNVLTKANKTIKEQDNQLINKLANNSLTNLIKSSVLFACSDDMIILAVENRNTANEINEQANNESIKKTVGKKVFAITYEQRDYLTTYFKTKQNEIKTENVVKTQKEENNSNDKLQALFGKDGFDIIEG